jgi:hypothetical protein
MIPVVKQTFIENIYKNFYDIVSAIDSPGSIFNNRIFPSMPDVELSQANSYPIIILESPNFNVTQFDIGKSLAEGTLTFTVYTTQAKLRDQIVDKIIYAIETNKGVLANMNIKQVFFGSITTDQVARGKIKINMTTIPVTYKFYFDKTFAH